MTLWVSGTSTKPARSLPGSRIFSGPIRKSADLVDDAIYALSCSGPALGRPLVDTITGSAVRNLKELRPGSTGTSEIRILFAFDPWRSAILLVAGDKAGKWKRWYAETIPRAEHLYEIYLKERGEEEARL